MKLLLQNALFLNSVTMYFVVFGLYAGFPVSIYWTWNGFSNSVMNWINKKDEPENFKENHSLPLFHVRATQQGSCSSCSCTHPKEHDCNMRVKNLEIINYSDKKHLVSNKYICMMHQPSKFFHATSPMRTLYQCLNLSRLWKQCHWTERSKFQHLSSLVILSLLTVSRNILDKNI